MQQAPEQLWSKFVVRLGQLNPFFACIALFTRFVPDEKIELAQTTGVEIRVNPDFILNLSDEEAFSYLMHQVLHLALLHDKRRQGRDIEVWNLAADIVINHIIVEATRWPVAPKTAWDDRFIEDSVEQVYLQLIKEIDECTGPLPGTVGEPQPDSFDQDSDSSDPGNSQSGNTDDDSGGNAQSDVNDEGETGNSSDDGANGDDQHSNDNGSATDAGGSAGSGAGSSISNTVLDFYQAHNDLKSQGSTQQNTGQNGDPVQQKLEHEKYWEDAIVQANYATADVTAKGRGMIPAGLKREFERIARSRVNWRRELWRFVSDRQSDYSEFDARHIHRGLYLEELRVDGLSLAIAVDTSGSISYQELGMFMRELEEIQGLYSDINISLYYCDASVDGPYSLSGKKPQIEASPVGFGGTSFVPVFKAIEKLTLTDRPDCIIYFTDGDGEFPKHSPVVQTLWVLVDDGVEESDIPFGRTIRMPPLAA
jgi:predicted metal-dependent peptidase